MTRRAKRRLLILVILAVLLALVGVLYLNYRATNRISLDFKFDSGASIDPPEYLYSFSGDGKKQLASPIGVLVDGNVVYVPDSRNGEVFKFDTRGKLLSTFGTGELVVPLYVAKNPKNGNLYITDRRLRSIEIYTQAGKRLRTFDPKLPKEELPEFLRKEKTLQKTSGGRTLQWAPVALAFAPSGDLYVTEVLNGHRVLHFDPSGKFVKSIGTVGTVKMAKEAPYVFQFPNGIRVLRNEIWVADSNNRRIQVFDRDLKFKRIMVTGGLPRAIDFIPARSSDTSKSPQWWVEVDTLSHDGTLWTMKGEKIAGFGTNGVLEGQFSYPTGMSIGGDRRIYIADTSNGRVQVWGWPEDLEPIPTPKTPLQWLLCLSPLLLIPLLMALRRKRFFATEDFIDHFTQTELLDRLPDRRRRWLVLPEVYEKLKGVKQGDVDLAELLREAEHSESDARALVERLEIDLPSAIILSVAQRAHVFCTDDAELRRLAKLLEVDVVDHDEFLERFAKEVRTQEA